MAQLNYARHLRVRLARSEVCEVLREARRRVWPRLNQESVTLVSPKEFTRRWSDLGVDFRLTKLSWPGGLALLGFYIKRTRGLFERPLIYVNTAHHPAMVGAAFAHEMGHHLTSQIFGSRHEPARLLLDGEYAEHLNDSAELAADVLVSLGVFPQGAARRTFGEIDEDEPSEDVVSGFTGVAFARVLQHVATRYAVKFDAIFSLAKKHQTLAALIHYTKLRQALLDEYGI